jgi:hypothetical protein
MNLFKRNSAKEAANEPINTKQAIIVEDDELQASTSTASDSVRRDMASVSNEYYHDASQNLPNGHTQTDSLRESPVIQNRLTALPELPKTLREIERSTLTPDESPIEVKAEITTHVRYDPSDPAPHVGDSPNHVGAPTQQ